MATRKNSLPRLWQTYINQPGPISAETAAYVAALKARVDQLEIENADLFRRLPAYKKQAMED